MENKVRTIVVCIAISTIIIVAGNLAHDHIRMAVMSFSPQTQPVTVGK